MHPYNQALNAFVHTNAVPIAALFGIAGPDLGKQNLGKMLENTIGGQLQVHFEFHGRFDSRLLNELKLVPFETRVEKRLSAAERKEIGQVQNRKLDKVAEMRREDDNFLSAQMARWRTARMRSEMRKLAEASRNVELQTQRLVATVNRYRHNPSAENRYDIVRSIKGLNKSLVNIHYRARSAGAWAIRAGYTPKAASRALDHLYMQKMTRLEGSLNRLDGWLNSKGIRSEMGGGVRRRQDIILGELLKAQGIVSKNVRKSRYAENNETPPGFEHG